MRTLIGFTSFITAFFLILRTVENGLFACSTNSFVPYLIMFPGTLAMIITLLFTADKINFCLLNIPYRPVFIVSVSCSTLSTLLLVFGNSLTDQVNTWELLPHYLLFFQWIPFLIIVANRFRKLKDTWKPKPCDTCYSSSDAPGAASS